MPYAKELAQVGDVQWAERWEAFLVKAPSFGDAAKVLRDMCGVSPPKPKPNAEKSEMAAAAPNVNGESTTAKDEATANQVKQAGRNMVFVEGT